MSGYLARFFRNPATGAGQLHLLKPQQDWVLGEHLYAREISDPRPPGSYDAVADLLKGRFFEQTFDTTPASVAAFEALATGAIAQGFVLMDLMAYSDRVIPPDAKPKPVWQQNIDRYYLQALAHTFGDAAPIEREAQAEPLLLYAQALHVHREKKAYAAEALPLALAAREAIDKRGRGPGNFYTWSLPWVEVAAAVHDELFLIYADLKEVTKSFAAIREAYDLAPDTFRSENLATMQCFSFPQFREDGFEMAFQFSNAGGYKHVLDHPEYAAFAARRQADISLKRPIVRRHAMVDPASAGQIAAAEGEIAHKLPAGYRAFLATRGRSKIAFHVGDDSAALKFCGPKDLSIWAGVLQHWFDITGDTGGAHSRAWRQKLGVERRALFSVATPWDNSSCVVLHLEAGPAYGRCFLWHHDEAYDLVPLGETFEAALIALEAGFVAGDPRIRSFFR